MFRRLLPAAVILSLLGAIIPAPAYALSTQSEVELGRESDQQIVEGSVVETDPLLNAYVQSIADKLWKQVARKDVPYNIKVIKDQEVNSFATLGGYVYINEGLVDFVQSDDELASVIGHETGHIERRHVVTMQSKAQAMSLLFGIASMFSPLIYNFGNLLEAGAMAKMSRADELQADRYGLQLMSRAGYDPRAMVTMMDHLGVLEGEHNDLVTKYLQDHPGSPDRRAHLVGYPELDPKVVTPQEDLVRALSDAERARYEYSSLRFNEILKTDPNNAEAMLGLGQDDLALGFPSKSEQTLAEASQKGSPQTRAQADQRIASLRQMEAQHVTLVKPNLAHLRDLLSQAEATQEQAATQIADRRDQGRDQLKQANARLDVLQYEVPDFSRVNVQHGSRLEAVLRNITTMARSINSAISDASVSITQVGSLEKNKESGLLLESRDILKEMRSSLDAQPIPSDTLAVLPSYPSMLGEMRLADSDMIRSVDGARASLVVLDQSLGDLDEFFKQLGRTPLSFNGDISQTSYEELTPLMQKASANLNNAAVSASQALQLHNMARTRQLSSRITMLGLGTSPQRYSTLQYALDQRFGTTGIDYLQMLRDNLTPGDVTVATILAADIKSSPEAIVQEMQQTKKSPVDLADQHGMHAWPLEIFTGLVYLDYTDDPQKEMHPGT